MNGYLVFTRRGRLNIRRTVWSMVDYYLNRYGNFTIYDIQSAIFHKSGGAYAVKESSIRLTILRDYGYLQKRGMYYFSP